MGRTVIIHTQTAKLGISDRFEQICLIDMASIASDGLSMNRDFEYTQPSCPSIDLAVGACLLDASGIVDELDLLLTGGRLNAHSRSVIAARYTQILADGSGTSESAATRLRTNLWPRKVRWVRVYCCVVQASASLGVPDASSHVRSQRVSPAGVLGREQSLAAAPAAGRLRQAEAVVRERARSFTNLMRHRLVAWLADASDGYLRTCMPQRMGSCCKICHLPGEKGEVDMSCPATAPESESTFRLTWAQSGR